MFIDDIISGLKTVSDNLIKYQQSSNKDSARLYDEIFRLKKLCIMLRKLPYYCNFSNNNGNIQKNVDTELLKAHEIVVCKTTEGYPFVKIPRLLPSRSAKTKGSLDFVRYPLQLALTKYVEENGYPVKENKKKVIVIRHNYPSDMPEFRCRDHDNYEVKGIIDDIASYFLVDDSIIYCDRLYLSKPDDDFSTEIFIIPEPDLTNWLTKNFREADGFAPQKE